MWAKRRRELDRWFARKLAKCGKSKQLAVRRKGGKTHDLTAIVVELEWEKREGLLDVFVGCGSEQEGGLLGTLRIKEAQEVEGIGFGGAKQIKAQRRKPRWGGVGVGLWFVELRL